MPNSGATVASVSSSFHTYDANCHPSRVCSINRVSARRPKRNSFQKRVPTGNLQTSGFEPSMNPPGGRLIQRDLVAPSDQSGYWGLNGRRLDATVFVAQSE